MCLIQGKENDFSNHGHFLTTANPAKHDEVTLASFYARRRFTSFERVKSKSSNLHYLIAVNPIPNTPDNSLRHESFEIFRDWAIVETTGEWPANRSVFKRSEVLIEFVENNRYTPGSQGKGHYVKEVKEMARFNPGCLTVAHCR
ncbi:MAG TPA: hypothetical protein VGE44_14605 [Daejeonella sp.]|uniref:hypothetical protein n=1 Tax=Daejeonella sp. TaxID=2805397 RepID=UPI002ED8DC92